MGVPRATSSAKDGPDSATKPSATRPAAMSANTSPGVSSVPTSTPLETDTKSEARPSRSALDANTERTNWVGTALTITSASASSSSRSEVAVSEDGSGTPARNRGFSACSLIPVTTSGSRAHNVVGTPRIHLRQPACGVVRSCSESNDSESPVASRQQPVADGLAAGLPGTSQPVTGNRKADYSPGGACSSVGRAGDF